MMFLEMAYPALLLLLGVLVVYYYFMIKAVVEMLQRDANPVLLVFTFLSLIPFPLLVVLGVVILVIWRRYTSAQPGF